MASAAIACVLLALRPTAVGGFRGGGATPASLARPAPSRASSFLRSRPPSKGDFYDDDELSDLLSLHEALTINGEDGSGDGRDGGGQVDGEDDGLDFDPFPVKKPDDGPPPPDAFSIPGIHDLVLRTVREIDDVGEKTPAPADAAARSPVATVNNPALLAGAKPTVRAIATDVDGTLLHGGKRIHPITERAVLRAIDAAYGDGGGDGRRGEKNANTTTTLEHFFVATGKSRRGAMLSLPDSVGDRLPSMPGVYIQGLYCVGRDGSTVVFERKLPSSAVAATERLADDLGLSVVGYDGDVLLSTDLTGPVVSLSEYYGEPTVEIAADGEGNPIRLSEHGPGLHKLLVMDDDVGRLAPARERLEELFAPGDDDDDDGSEGETREGRCTITQALPTMLEVLPFGCGKGLGVRKVCDSLGIDVESELMALGDAENDADMLGAAAIGIAVGNACPAAREGADLVMEAGNDEGGAGVAIELFGL